MSLTLDGLRDAIDQMIEDGHAKGSDLVMMRLDPELETAHAVCGVRLAAHDVQPGVCRIEDASTGVGTFKGGRGGGAGFKGAICFHGVEPVEETESLPLSFAERRALRVVTADELYGLD